MKLFMGLFAGLAVSAPWHQALAQTQPVSPDISSIVVLGAGLPLPPGTPAYGSITIGHDQLANGASGMIENALKDVAGFQQFRRSDSRSANPSAQGVTLRALGGNASSRTLVLLDGMPIADPFFGFIPFTALVPDRLSTVRVTRGGGIGAFGAGAVSGTVELASAMRNDLPVASASAFHGSHDATSLSASVAPGLGAGFVTISGRWDRGDGFWTTPLNQRVPASVPAKYKNWSVALRAVAPLGLDYQIQAHTLVYNDDRVLRFAGADNHSEGQDAGIRLIGGVRWKIDALAYVQARNFSNIVISPVNFKKTLDQRNTPSTGIGGKFEIRPPTGNAHLMRIGADTRFATGDMYEDVYLPSGSVRERRHAGGHQNTTGLFIENDWTPEALGGRLVLTGGGRIDHWSIDGGFYENRSSTGIQTFTAHPSRKGWESSFRAGILLHVKEGIALRSAAYSGFRLPTLNELYRPFVVGSITTNANAGLKPEKLRGIEGGIDLVLARKTTLSATLFYNKLENAIANVTLNAATRQRQNVDAIIAKGLEITADTTLADFTLSASYAYTDSKVSASGQGFDGLRPSQTARHAASATLRYAPAHGPAVSTSIRYSGSQYEDDLQSDILPSALTVEAVVHIPLGRGITVVGRAENIFDVAVYTRNTGGSMDLGTPRTLWIGIKITQN